MASYRLTKAAKEDLYRVWSYGVIRFGQDQADRYYHAFFERFEEIARSPNSFQAVPEVKSGLRRAVCGVDSIYFRVVNRTVEILAIIGRQDAQRWL